jgi:hypothetical protein
MRAYLKRLLGGVLAAAFPTWGEQRTLLRAVIAWCLSEVSTYAARSEVRSCISLRTAETAERRVGLLRSENLFDLVELWTIFRNELLFQRRLDLVADGKMLL